MADITMCFGKGCPLKETCYRYLAVSEGEYQTYFTGTPFSSEFGKCDFYWKYDLEENTPSA